MKQEKNKINRNDRAETVKTPEPPQHMNPSIPMQENSGQQKQQRPGRQTPETKQNRKGEPLVK